VEEEEAYSLDQVGIGYDNRSHKCKSNLRDRLSLLRSLFSILASCHNRKKERLLIPPHCPYWPTLGSSDDELAEVACTGCADCCWRNGYGGRSIRGG